MKSIHLVAVSAILYLSMGTSAALEPENFSEKSRCRDLRIQAAEDFDKAKSNFDKYDAVERQSDSIRPFRVDPQLASSLFTSSNYKEQFRRIFDKSFMKNFNDSDPLWFGRNIFIRDQLNGIGFDRREVVYSLFVELSRCERSDVEECLTKNEADVFLAYLKHVKKLKESFPLQLKPLDYVILGYNLGDQDDCRVAMRLKSHGGVENCEIGNTVIALGATGILSSAGKLVGRGALTAANDLILKSAHYSYTTTIVANYRAPVRVVLGTVEKRLLGDMVKNGQMDSELIAGFFRHFDNPKSLVEGLKRFSGKIPAEKYTRLYEEALIRSKTPAEFTSLFTDAALHSSHLETEWMVNSRLHDLVGQFFRKATPPTDLELNQFLRALPRSADIKGASMVKLSQEKVLEDLLTHTRTPAQYIKYAEAYAKNNATGERMLLNSREHFKSLSPNLWERAKLVDIMHKVGLK